MTDVKYGHMSVPDVPTAGRFWVLVGSGGFWRVVVGSGGFWRVLVGSGGFWRVLAGSGGLWVTDRCFPVRSPAQPGHVPVSAKASSGSLALVRRALIRTISEGVKNECNEGHFLAAAVEQVSSS